MRVRPRRSARHSKTQYLVAAIVPALIVVLSITGFVWAQQKVTVVEDGRSQVIQTQANDVAGVLSQAGVALDDGDVVSPSRGTKVRRGMTIVVRHTVPVSLDLGGEPVAVDVVGETVADALVAAGIDPAAHPEVTPSLDAALEPSMTIKVPDVFMRVLRKQETVEHSVKHLKDPRLTSGVSRVVSQGTPGKLLRVYRVMVAGGIETTPVLTAESVIVAPKPTVIAMGTAPVLVPASHRASVAELTPPAGGRRVRVTATGYSAQQPGLDSTTATGRRARYGVIAVDPNVIPLGSRVFVPGYGYAIAADTGGDIVGSRIDLCFDTVAEAIAWGRRTVTIVVLD